MITTTNKKIPQASGIPIAGSAFSLMKNPVSFFVDQYHKNGPVYKVKAFHKSFIVMSGIEANKFMHEEGKNHFKMADSWGVFRESFNAEKHILCDGEEHIKIRKIMRRGFSPIMLENRVPEVIDYMKSLLQSNANVENISGVRFMRKIIADQMGNLMANTYANEYFDDILFFTRSLINIGAERWPKNIVTKLPKYKKSRKRCIELSKKIIKEHRDGNKSNREFDLIDDLLAVQKNEETFFSENDLLLASLSPFMTGIETVASSLAFILYDLLKHPNVLAEVKHEVDQVFIEGVKGLKDLKKFKKLFAVILESMRIRSVAVAQSRVVDKPFDFEGFRIEKGETIYSVFSVTHFLEEYFPSPQKFDFKRFLTFEKHTNPSYSFVPFGVGAHACPGANLSDVLILTIMASMIHFAEFEQLSKSYKFKITANPVPSLDKKFTFKIKEMRNL